MNKVRYTRQGDLVYVTRRTMERRFFLKPSARMRQLFTYLLTWAAQMFGLQIVVFYCGSTHYHLVVWDPRGRVPAFVQVFNGRLAKAVNFRWGREGVPVWDSQKASRLPILDTEKLWQLVVYTMAQAVQDGLVSNASEWPGSVTRPDQLGTVREVRRPGGLFGRKTIMPETLTLQMVIPPPLLEWARMKAEREGHPPPSDERCGEMVRAEAARRLAARELEEQTTTVGGRKVKRRFLGRRGCLRVGWNQQAAAETKTNDEAGGRALGKPADVKCGSALRFLTSSREVYAAAMLEWLWFEREYAAALTAFCEGQRSVAFPYGTYKMVVTYGCECRPPT